MRWAILSVLFLGLLGGPVYSATWYVTQSGSGDAPTIAAAVDSAASGDTVLVAAGTYGVAALDMKPGLVLTSESGPSVTKLVEGTPDPWYEPVYGGVLFSYGTNNSGEISGFWLDGFAYESLGAISIAGSYTVVDVRNCVFTNSYNAIIVGLEATANIDNCTFYGNTWGLNFQDGVHINLSYSILWDRLEGNPIHVWAVGVDYLNIDDFLFPYGYNVFSQDPQFCGPPENLFLQSDSPCTPGNHWWGADDMRLMGALPVACGPVNTETRSWGEVKALYR